MHEKTTWQPLSESVAAAAERLLGLWESTESGVLHIKPEHRSADFGRFLDGPQSPLACSTYDQFGEIDVDNPLWDIIRWFPTSQFTCHCSDQPKIHLPYAELHSKVITDLHKQGVDRQGLCTAFSFSVCTPGDIFWMRHLVGKRSVVELGAGRGYWAWMLQQHGVTVYPYEPHVPGDDNLYLTTPGTFTTVYQDDHTAVKRHTSEVLFISWPGYDDPWAYEALRRYRGDMVIYAGEGDGGCTADDQFHELLERDWEWLSTSTRHVTWWGIHDRLNAYVRK